MFSSGVLESLFAGLELAGGCELAAAGGVEAGVELGAVVAPGLAGAVVLAGVLP